MKSSPLALLPLLCTLPVAGQSRFLSVEEVVEMPRPPAAQRIAYGKDPLQFGELRLPSGDGPHPVAIVIHGGCWLSQYDIGHIGNLTVALTDAGFATWALEYRRVGNPGGGWPGTFQDVAHGADHLREIAGSLLDLERVIVVGHSAGGHLALWLAARPHIQRDSPLFTERPIRLKGVLGLAAAADLRLLYEKGSCENVADKLLGGSPEQFPERYDNASPQELAPLGVPQILVNGAHDIWSEIANSYYEAVQKSGDPIRRVVAPESAHFEMIVPSSSTWPLVRQAALELLAGH